MRRRIAICIMVFVSGCQAPLAQLSFPYRAIAAGEAAQSFDVDGDGRAEFTLTFDEAGRVDAQGYDDDGDGVSDRVYRLRDYDNELVPHLVILLDSVPFHAVAERYAAGEFRWFDPPTKIIAPFPSMTEVCLTDLLHAPPTPGAIDHYYDRPAGRLRNVMWKRAVEGYRYPWERLLAYRSRFYEEGLAYLNPRPWYQAELERARKAMDESPNRVTMVYLTSSSGMACKHGRAGVDEVLDGMARLCLQLLYERRGALKISVLADHGHNLVRSANIDVEALLREGGFRVTKQLRRPDDVVLELSGLVTYAAVRTAQPARVATQLLTEPGMELAMYMESDRVIVRSVQGSAAIQFHHGRLRYEPITHDVLGYAPVLARLDADETGFASRDAWFAATVDHEYPDAPARIWDAFHHRVISPGEVMFTTRDGFCAGDAGFERFITMESTHGSLNKINSTSFLMTMTGRVDEPLRMREVMPAIEPTWRPGAGAP